MTHTLSSAKARVLHALIHATEDGWSATVQEVTDRAGLASKATTYNHLVDLIHLGLVETHPRNPRGGYLPISRTPLREKGAE